MIDGAGKILLPHTGYLPQPQYYEVHPGECWGEAAGQTALLQKDHGAQTGQGSRRTFHFLQPKTFYLLCQTRITSRMKGNLWSDDSNQMS